MFISRKGLLCFLSAINIFVLSIASIGTSRFIILPFTIILIMCNKSMFENLRKKTILFILSSILISFLIFINYLGFLTYKVNIGYTAGESLLANIFKLFLIFIVIFFIDTKEELIKVLKLALIIHFVFYAFQFIVVYLSGYYIDYLNIFTGMASRYGSGYSLPFVGTIYRPTGFYLEPSTFASFILVLSTLKVYLSDKVERFDYLTVLVCISTFSLAAIFYGFIYFFVLFLKNNKLSYKKIFFTFIIVLSLPLLISLASTSYEKRMSVTGGTASEIRSNLNKVVLINQSNSEIVFGNGLLGLPNELADILKNNSFWSNKIAAVNDNGIWLFIIMKLGILGLIALLIFFYKISNNFLQFIMLSNILLTKMSLFHVEFMLFIFVLVLYRNRGLES